MLGLRGAHYDLLSGWYDLSYGPAVTGAKPHSRHFPYYTSSCGACLAHHGAQTAASPSSTPLVGAAPPIAKGASPGGSRLSHAEMLRGALPRALWHSRYPRAYAHGTWELKPEIQL